MQTRCGARARRRRSSRRRCHASCSTFPAPSWAIVGAFRAARGALASAVLPRAPDVVVGRVDLAMAFRPATFFLGDGVRVRDRIGLTAVGGDPYVVAPEAAGYRIGGQFSLVTDERAGIELLLVDGWQRAVGGVLVHRPRIGVARSSARRSRPAAPNCSVTVPRRRAVLPLGYASPRRARRIWSACSCGWRT